MFEWLIMENWIQRLCLLLVMLGSIQQKQLMVALMKNLWVKLLWEIPKQKGKVISLLKVMSAGEFTLHDSWKHLDALNLHVDFFTDNGEVNVWDEINEALTAKKAKLSQGGGWSKENSGTRSWSNRALRCSALGPTMAFLRSQNGL